MHESSTKEELASNPSSVDLRNYPNGDFKIILSVVETVFLLIIFE